MLHRLVLYAVLAAPPDAPPVESGPSAAPEPPPPDIAAEPAPSPTAPASPADPIEPEPASEPATPVVRFDPTLVEKRPPDAVERARIGLLIGQYGQRERKERILRGSIGMAFSALQMGIGIYMLTSARKYGPTVPLSGWMNVGVGTYNFSRSLARVVVRGPLEKLSKSYAYTATTAEHPTEESLDDLERQWKKSVKGARIFRYVSAGIYIAAGLGCVAYAGYLLFSPPRYHEPNPEQFSDPDGSAGDDLRLVAEGRYIVGASLSVTGMLYVAEGVYSVLLPTPVEASWAAYHASHRGRLMAGMVGRMPMPIALRRGAGLAWSGRF